MRILIALLLIASPAFALNAERLPSGNFLVKGDGGVALYLTPSEYDAMIENERIAEHNRKVAADQAEAEAVARIAEMEALKSVPVIDTDTTIY